MTTPAPRPPWLRPSAVVAAITLHAAALAGYRPQEGLRLAGPIEIALVSDPAPEAAPTPESLPAPEARAEPEPVEPETQTPPEPVPPEPPPIEAPPPAPEPPPIPVPPSPPVAEPPPPPEPPPPVEVESPAEKKKPPQRRKPPREDEPRRQVSTIDSTRSEAARAEAAAAARSAAASYAAEVSAELRRHRHYPAAAREAGITGVVVVAFVIGPGGRVATHSIVRSSGHPILDQAVRGMLRAFSLPPPPGGFFRSTVPVRFDLIR